MTTRRRLLRNIIAAGAGSAALGLSAVSGAKENSQTSPCGVPHWDETFDVIVVGSGVAGMTAAVRCRSLGIKRVVVIEKLPVQGGNSSIAVGDICAVDSPITRKAGVKDSVEQFVADFTRAGEGYNHKPLTRAVAEQSGKSIEWLISEGCQFSDKLMKHQGHSAFRIHHPVGGCGQGVLKPLRKAFLEKYEGDIRIRTKMDAIIKDEKGRVVGLKVREHYDFDQTLESDDLENTSGVVKYYRAEKGVVLAFGGYARDPKWRREDFPLFNPQMVEMASLGATGGGLRAAFAAGARPFGMSFMRYGFDLAGGDCRFTILLHPETGKRFMDESLPRDPLANAALEIAEATGRFPVAIVDSETLTHFEDPNRTKRQLKLGSLREYASLEALCKAEKLPFDEVRKTVDAYNAAVAAKKDEEFNKDFAKAEFMTCVKAPFYASALIPRANNTVGGMLVTPKAEVVSVTDGKPIPGLYAAGECASGVHGKASLPSASIVVGITFGMIAAREIAAKA